MIRSFSVGKGDMFFIKHDNENFTIIDCCMSEEDRDFLIKELKSASTGKDIVRFISTHPDDDHILGLSFLHEKMNIRNFYCVKNEATKPDWTGLSTLISIARYETTPPKSSIFREGVQESG